MSHSVPIPEFFAPNRVGDVWRVPYEERAVQAQAWAQSHGIKPADTDRPRLCLLAIDVQNTFCIPGFELFVGGASGQGAVDDTRRLCEFIYRNLGQITEIVPTMDTHRAIQIFHAAFWVDAEGQMPAPMTMVNLDDVQSGRWRVNPAIVPSLNASLEQLEAFALHYVKRLSDNGKYPLTVWPYHSMLGGIGHSLVSAFEEACFFHNLARQCQTRFELKGNNPLTENYSALRPEVLDDPKGQPVAKKNQVLIQHLLTFDAVAIAGQAKSHCVAWTIDDLLNEIQQVDASLAQKIYLLEDCSSPVVVPDIVDFSDAADAAYQKFAAAGMNIIQSTSNISSWWSSS
ncbi:isochorismatase [Leptolyngbyaceae cyanobacterium CCMR0082]|uniref:Isochorismatase n=2 Tax=Adonisia turfae TaxID=2950184 RepID=A0A6M0S5N3_9CYAN|nr:isochorismatase [Adonisia turfae]MDV3350440.1 isochorismatase [Leptothoe sp. LEGE 181152]NEZ59686.1 isochorismatase [Adonisia turfae CCMR0081]NEZ63291.1 isochorismatase [Adonisia turfae CCMR0082]